LENISSGIQVFRKIQIYVKATEIVAPQNKSSKKALSLPFVIKSPKITWFQLSEIFPK
jgi:hypothetical protein